MKIFILIILFIGGGCGYIPPLLHPVQYSASPASILEGRSEISADYQVTFFRRETSHNFLMHLEIFQDHVSLVGFGALGEILFECRYENNQAEKCDTLVGGIPSRMFLQDIELIYWPLYELNSNIKDPNFSLIEEYKKRIIFHKGIVYAEITYDKDQPLLSRVKYNNKKYNYQMDIDLLHIKKEENYE